MKGDESLQAAAREGTTSGQTYVVNYAPKVKGTRGLMNGSCVSRVRAVFRRRRTLALAAAKAGRDR